MWLPASQLAAPLHYLSLCILTTDCERDLLCSGGEPAQKFGVCSSRLGLFGVFLLLFFGFVFFPFQWDSLNFAVVFLYFSGFQLQAPTLSHPLCLVRLFLPHVVPGGERSARAEPCLRAVAGGGRSAKPPVINCHVC